MTRQRAFTLVEMLVVMGIIAVLAGLLLPALASARERGRKARCSGNLGQLGKTLAIYRTGYSEYFPSYANYGMTGGEGPAVDPYEGGGRKVTEYQAKASYDRLASRNMVLAYGSGKTSGQLKEGQRNFIANGLGVMLKKHHLRDAGILLCPSLAGTTNTYYGHAGLSDPNGYAHRTDVWKRLRCKNHMKAVEHGNGTWMTTAGGSELAVAILSSYSYRLQPWFWATGSPGVRQTLAYTRPSDSETVAYTRPIQAAHYMCPPFKTSKQISLRAVASDSFDYGLDGDMWKAPMVDEHHRTGYNVLFADSHVSWYFDGGQTIGAWEWSDDASATNDLTISSTEAHAVWHIFDETNEMDL